MSNRIIRFSDVVSTSDDGDRFVGVPIVGGGDHLLDLEEEDVVEDDVPPVVDEPPPPLPARPPPMPNRYSNGMYYDSLPLRDLGGGRRGARGPMSSAASDTSSAAGFPSSGRPGAMSRASDYGFYPGPGPGPMGYPPMHPGMMRPHHPRMAVRDVRNVMGYVMVPI